jgi:hypothetical protein
LRCFNHDRHSGTWFPQLINCGYTLEANRQFG